MSVAHKEPWLEGAEQMAESWVEAQRLLWQSWGELSRRATQNGAFNPFAEAAEVWQRLAERTLSAWRDEALKASGEGASAVAGEVVERLVESQTRFLHLLEETAKAYQGMLPHPADGDAWSAGAWADGWQDGWQKALESYVEAQRAYVLSTSKRMLEASGETAELWSRYLGEWQKLAQLWQDAAPTPHHPGMDLWERFWGVYDQTLGRALNSPTFGYGREQTAELLAGFDAWLELRRAEAEYQLVVAELWQKALEAGLRELVARAQAGQPPTSAKAILNLFIATADEVFVREFGSEAYIAAQGKLLNAAMAYRLRMRAVMEGVFKAFDLPTRTELDEAYQALYELRRELRELKRQQAESAAAQDSSAELAALRRELAELREALSPADTLAANLPIENYTSLSVAEVTERLDGLSRYELEQVRAFELLHKNRKTLLTEIDRRLQEGA